MNKILLTAAVIVATSFTLCAQNNKEMKTSKTLVAYFSATGTTAQVARDIADLTGGTLYEIAPKSAYTSADLDWNNKQSRSSVEMNDPQARPELKTTATDHNLKGKTLIPFATSGGSGVNNSVNELKKTYPDLKWKDGKLLNRTNKNALQQWINQL